MISMKKIWVIANWKSNKNLAEALDWVSQVGEKLHRKDSLNIVICPQFSEIEEVAKEIKVGKLPLMVGSQDLSPFGEGPFTGEESASSLQGLVGLSILGHSERRKNFGETDEIVAKKAKRALEAGIIPLVCVQNENTPIPDGCSLVAYEPTFAIGTGNPDTPENANNVAYTLGQKYETQDDKLEVLYGGSVNSENVLNFVKKEHISGVLVGGASLDPQEFLKIIDECAKV